MQLRELFVGAGRQLWILAVIPLVAVGFAAWNSTTSPPQYTATATVSVTPPRGAETAAAVTQTVDSFRSAIQAHAAVLQAADNAGVSTAVIERGVTSSRVGASHLVEVVYTGSQQDKAEPVLRETSIAAQQLVFSRHVAAAEGERAAAQEAYDESLKEMTNAAEEAGLKLPLEEYREKANEVTQLRVAIVQADARNDVSTEPIEEALAEAEEDLSELGAKVADLEGQQYELDRARTRLADANDNLAETEALLASATGPTSIEVGPVTAVPRSTAVIRALVTAGVIGFALALALFALFRLVTMKSGSPTESAISEDRAIPEGKAASEDPVAAEQHVDPEDWAAAPEKQFRPQLRHARGARQTPAEDPDLSEEIPGRQERTDTDESSFVHSHLPVVPVGGDGSGVSRQ